ncbi:uncharacterized protein LOC128745601 [Sabethes cyaneus]|uniref:uncharacterized protein LOC128745601 n=1 Tax=Sabethes cyaneus TaxID=53552 RepID=UPI00237E035B|nr:uncharacterized protein LOC128745601 [Sabethes cyaneus]
MSKLREQSKALTVTTNSILLIEQFILSFDAQRDCDKIESRLLRLDQLFDRYMTTSISVEVLANEDAENKLDLTKQRDEMEKKYYCIRDFLLSRKQTQAPTAIVPIPSPVRSSVVRLPKIDLPVFDGDMNNWVPFRDAYAALIHNNDELAPVDKFHYLMAALKGPVKKLLDTTSVTTDNYKIAWDLLVGRFNNKRLLIKNHIAALFAIEPVRRESSDAILTLVDQVERHVKILTTLGESTESWSSLLVHMICSRLDKITLREWERSTGDVTDTIPTYADLIRFLHVQSRILLSLDNNTVAVYPTTNERPHLCVAHTSTVSQASTSRCAACTQLHRIHDCETFKCMTLDEKQDIVRKKRLCWNCLSFSHISRDCLSKPCWKCNEKHHSLLHPTSTSDRYARSQGQFDTVDSPSSTRNNAPESTVTHLEPAGHSASTTALSASLVTEAVHSTVLLSTAVVKVYGPNGTVTLARALLDSCSEANFITERIVQVLGLNRSRKSSTISGMGGFTVDSTHYTVATFSSVDSSFADSHFQYSTQDHE